MSKNYTIINNLSHYLIQNNKYCKLHEYTKLLHVLYNIRFDKSIEEFIYLLYKHVPCIDGKYFIFFDIINNKEYIFDKILELITLNEKLTINKDYVCTSFHKSIKSNYKCKVVYYFHPKVFKYLLMKYSYSYNKISYYLFLEDCIYYYNEYINRYNLYNYSNIVLYLSANKISL